MEGWGRMGNVGRMLKGVKKRGGVWKDEAGWQERRRMVKDKEGQGRKWKTGNDESIKDVEGKGGTAWKDVEE